MLYFDMSYLFDNRYNHTYIYIYCRCPYKKFTCVESDDDK